MQIPDGVIVFLKRNELAEYPLKGVKQSNRRWFEVDLLGRIQGKVFPDFLILWGEIKYVLVFLKRSHLLNHASFMHHTQKRLMALNKTKIYI